MVAEVERNDETPNPYPHEIAPWRFIGKLATGSKTLELTPQMKSAKGRI
jgi:hypothetical protein